MVLGGEMVLRAEEETSIFHKQLKLLRTSNGFQWKLLELRKTDKIIMQSRLLQTATRSGVFEDLKICILYNYTVGIKLSFL